jgi:hypothetical protein
VGKGRKERRKRGKRKSKEMKKDEGENQRRWREGGSTHQ